MKQRRVIDKREKAKFMVDDAFLEKMARLCGWQGTIVYTSLCRHANKDQECFPSIGLMAAQHRVSRTTVLKGIRALEERCVIYVNKARSKGGKWLNNTYILLDKAEWDYSQVHKIDMENGQNEVITESMSDTLPSPSGVPSQVYPDDTKEAHDKETHKLKETHLLQTGGGLPIVDVFQLVPLPFGDGQKEDGQEIESVMVEPKSGTELNKAIGLFQRILPGDFIDGKSAFEKKPTRKAVEELMKRYTLESLENLIKKYEAGRMDRYRPTAGTVYEFCTSKLAKIEAFVSKPASGLWAHRSISTPEQAATREKQYQRIIDASRERSRKAKEEWNLLHPHQDALGKCIDKECRNHESVFWRQ